MTTLQPDPLNKNKKIMLSSNTELVLVLIPSGHFRFGEENTLITTSAFYIGCYPITVEQYNCFVNANGYAEASYWSRIGWYWKEMHKVTGPDVSGLSEPFHRANHPQVGLSWYEANAFCTWMSQHSGISVTLPNEIEWEKAARGTDGRKYPWGETPPTDIHCNFDDAKGHTTPVGLYPAGKSPFDCYDLAGNVWEWCRNTEGQLPYSNIAEREDLGTRALVTMRGGSWLSNRQEVTPWRRGYNYPIIRHSVNGFRVILKTEF